MNVEAMHMCMYAPPKAGYLDYVSFYAVCVSIYAQYLPVSNKDVLVKA